MFTLLTLYDSLYNVMYSFMNGLIVNTRRFVWLGPVILKEFRVATTHRRAICNSFAINTIHCAQKRSGTIVCVIAVERTLARLSIAAVVLWLT